MQDFIFVKSCMHLYIHIVKFVLRQVLINPHSCMVKNFGIARKQLLELKI